MDPGAAAKTSALGAKFNAHSGLLDAALMERDEVAIATARNNLLFAFEEMIDHRIEVSKAMIAAAFDPIKPGEKR